MTTPFRKLLDEFPGDVKQKLQEWKLEGLSAPEMATKLGVPYATFYQYAKDIGLIRKSPLELVTDEDWSRLSKRQISKKYLISFQHVYNYHRYHEGDINERIRAYRARQAEGDLDGSTSGSREGLQRLPSESEPSVCEGGAPGVAGHDDGRGSV